MSTPLVNIQDQLAAIRGARISVHAEEAGTLLSELGDAGFVATLSGDAAPAPARMPDLLIVEADCLLSDAGFLGGWQAGRGRALPVIAWCAPDSSPVQVLQAGAQDVLFRGTERDQLYPLVLRWVYPDRTPVPDGLPDLPGVDVHGALERMDGERELFLTMLEMFCQQCRDSGQELEMLVASGNWANLAAAAHKLKGSASLVGAQALSGMAGQVERMARDGLQDGYAPRMAIIRHQLGLLLPAFAACV